VGHRDTILYFTKSGFNKSLFFIVINNTQFHDLNLSGASIASTLTSSQSLRFGVGDCRKFKYSSAVLFSASISM
jgi:hypothetical protein